MGTESQTPLTCTARAVRAEGWGRNIMLGMLNGLTGYLDKITGGWLDNIRNGFISVWEGIKNALRPIVNGIGFMNGMISGVVSGMNAVIDAQPPEMHIPDWVPLFGGKSIGFSTPITAQQIPLLATGAVPEGTDALRRRRIYPGRTIIRRSSRRKTDETG